MTAPDGRQTDLSRVRKAYNQMAAFEQGSHALWLFPILHALAPIDVSSWLDIGTANGKLLERAILSRQRTLKRVRGIDIADEKLKLARERLAPYRQTVDVDLIEADFMDDGVNVGKFDVVTGILVAEYMGDPKDYLAKIMEHVAPEGMALLVDRVDATAEYQPPGSTPVQSALELLGTAHYMGANLASTLAGMIRSLPLMAINNDPEMQSLGDLHRKYHMSLADWCDLVAGFGGFVFPMGELVLVIIPKSTPEA